MNKLNLKSFSAKAQRIITKHYSDDVANLSDYKLINIGHRCGIDGSDNLELVGMIRDWCNDINKDNAADKVEIDEMKLKRASGSQVGYHKVRLEVAKLLK